MMKAREGGTTSSFIHFSYDSEPNLFEYKFVDRITAVENGGVALYT